MTTIYASTACLSGNVPLQERLDSYREHGIHSVELGAGVSVGEVFKPENLPRPGKYLLHNYFPPAKDSLIINLASQDNGIRERSIDFVRRALEISAKISAPLYSVHAGFITDPTEKFIFPEPASPKARSESLHRFVQSIDLLLPDAKRLGVRLLIENNVCLPKHKNVLLLSTTEEFQEFFTMIGAEKPGILVDTGHLNVSAHTFGFDRMSFLTVLAPYIGAFHLHENDGSTDRHLPVTEGGWVSKALRSPEFLSLPWIMEAKFSEVKTLTAQADLLQKIAAGEVG